MAEATESTTFTRKVEGVGVFTWKRRRLGDAVAIEAEFSRLTEGLANPTEFLSELATAIAELKVLTVVAPEGWDRDAIEAKDGFDPEVFRQLMTVVGVLRAAEADFRERLGQARAAGGTGEG